jgi:hypothetical protein
MFLPVVLVVLVVVTHKQVKAAQLVNLMCHKLLLALQAAVVVLTETQDLQAELVLQELQAQLVQ